MRAKLKADFESKDWSSNDVPRSGPGSTLVQTAKLRQALPGIFHRYKVRTFLDAPCGDWHWMRHVDLTGVHYIGGDISGEIVARNQSQFAAPDRTFGVLDITSDPLPKADMIMVRDCLMHLKHWLRWAFLENFVASGIPYLMTTVHHVQTNLAVVNNGGFKRFNPMASPFLLPQPLEWIHETADSLDPALLTCEATDKAQRSMAIWSLAQVRDRLRERRDDLSQD